MYNSCETLIAKINEWQKVILELEKLSDEFLNSGDEKIKERIENQKKEVEKQGKEYLDLTYQELPTGQKIFWPEKELIEELLKTMRSEKTFAYLSNSALIGIKDNHVVVLNLGIFLLENLPLIDLSRLINLEIFAASRCQLSTLPKLPRLIRKIIINDNPGIQIGDLSKLENLNQLEVNGCRLKKLPKLPESIRTIDMQNNLIDSEEKKRTRNEYPNARIF